MIKRLAVVLVAALALCLAPLVPQVASADNHGCGWECTTEVKTVRNEFAGTSVAWYSGHSGNRQLRPADVCNGCEWAFAPACWANRGPGDDVLCTNALQACPDPAVLERVYFRASAGAPWGNPIATLCIGGPDNQLRTPAQIGANLRQYFVAAAPNFVPAVQPNGRTLINFDTIFYADYAGAGARGAVLDTTVTVFGFPVRIVAEPSWTWTFEPGATESFTTPGDPYPSKTITYRYTTPGPRTVSVAASWKGEFFVAGDGPHDIAEPVVQTRTATVTAVSAESELVSGERG